MNLLPRRYGRKCFVSQIIANNSDSEAEITCSDLFFCLLAYPMTLFAPFCTCDKIAPISVPEASVANMNGNLKSGYSAKSILQDLKSFLLFLTLRKRLIFPA